MGMIFEIAAISKEQLNEFVTNPSSITSYVTLLGSVMDNVDSDQPVSLEKTWHGLHYTLTSSAEMGEPPLNFIAAGGQPIGEDLGYGPARALMPVEVRELDSALQQVSDQDFLSKFDPMAMAEAGIYPNIWDEEIAELQEEYLSAFVEMKSYIHKSAASGKGLLLLLT